MPTDLKTFLDRMAEEARPPRDVPRPMVRRARRRQAGTVVAAVTALAVAAAGTVVAVRTLQRPPSVRPAAVPCAWEQVEVPSQAPLSTRLLAVAAVADDDVWAVGDAYGEGESGIQRSVIYHWDGTTWSEVDHPRVQSLTGVSEASPDEIWVAGFDGNRGVALTWFGDQWAEFPLADPGTGSWHLFDIDAVSPDDVWAVGNTAGGGSGGVLVEHWNGERWSLVAFPDPIPSPRTADPYASLEAAEALTGEVWAVGQASKVAPAGPSNGIAVHLQGAEWRDERLEDVPAEDGMPYTSVFDVTIAGSEVWAVGVAASEPGYGGGGDRALIERRDADGWDVAEVLPADSRLYAIATTGSGDLWTVGASGVPGSYQPLVLERGGGDWSEVAVPGRGYLSAIGATPGGELWAVGAQEQGGALALRCR